VSIVPEYVLQTTIARGIKRMRNDSALIDQLFRNLDQTAIHQIRNFLKNYTIDLAINFPRTTLKIPAIVITLKSEKEKQAFLGDFLGTDLPDEFSYDGGISGQMVSGAASVAPISINPKTVFGPYSAFTGTENTLRITDRIWINDQYITGDEYTLRIVSGTGAGQIRKIIANTKNVLMVDAPWLSIPDNTSNFIITVQPQAPLGEPASLYNRVNLPNTIERRGGLYDLNYQIQVLCPTPELSIYLSIIIKSIFTQFRIFMEGQGLINLSMTMADLTPRADYQPDIVYSRAINLTFTFPFDIYEQQEGIVRSFHMVLEGEPPEGSISVDPVLIDSSWQVNPDPANGGALVDSLSDVQRLYFGVSTPPIVYDANFVQNTLAAQGTAIASKRQRYLNYTSGVGQYMYYAVPVRFDGISANFIDTGTQLEVGFIIAATIPITTTFGTEDYNIWRSETAGLGFVAVKIT